MRKVSTPHRVIQYTRIITVSFIGVPIVLQNSTIYCHAMLLARALVMNSTDFLAAVTVSKKV